MSEDEDNTIVKLFDAADAATPKVEAVAAAPIVVEDAAPNASDGSNVIELASKRGKRTRKKTGSESGDDAGDSPPPTPKPFGFDLDWMNERYALVLMGSKAVVVWEQPDATVEDRLRILSIDAFSAYFANKFTQVVGSRGEIKTISWANRWLHHKERRTYGGLEFWPDAENAPHLPGYLNLWRGFSVEPAEGAGSYAIFKDHLLNHVCSGNAEHYRYIFGWFAHMLQRPRERIGTSLIFKGKQGTGKTKVGEVFGSLIESHYILVDDPRYIVGQFNAHMASCLLIQAEEAVWAGDKRAEGRLKSLITSSVQMIEQKGIDPIRVTNYVRLMMTSNEDWVVPAGMDERRFAVFDVLPAVKGNYEYFREMDEQLDAGGRAALLADLLAFDLSSVELRDIPKTEALLEQKVRSLGSIERWWFERLQAGTVLRKQQQWECQIAKKDLATEYIEESDRIGIKRRASESEMGMSFRKLVPDIQSTRPWHTGSDGTAIRQWCWIFPPLDVCRVAFAEMLQQPVDWPVIDNEPERETGSDAF